MRLSLFRRKEAAPAPAAHGEAPSRSGVQVMLGAFEAKVQSILDFDATDVIATSVEAHEMVTALGDQVKKDQWERIERERLMAEMDHWREHIPDIAPDGAKDTVARNPEARRLFEALRTPITTPLLVQYRAVFAGWLNSVGKTIKNFSDEYKTMDSPDEAAIAAMLEDASSDSE